MLLCFKERGVIMLADLPDFNRIEKLHRATAPSEDEAGGKVLEKTRRKRKKREQR